MKQRKWIWLILLMAVYLLVSLYGCGNSSSDSGYDALSETAATLEGDNQKDNEVAQDDTSTEQAGEYAEESGNNVVEIAGVASRYTIGGGEVWYWINYYTDSGESERGYMNISGTILSEKPTGLYESSAGITGIKEYTVYDEEGSEIYSAGSSDDGWYIFCAEEFGTYLAYNVQSGLDAVRTYLGLINEDGDWIDGSPIEIDNSITFYEDGIFILNEMYDSELGYTLYDSEGNEIQAVLQQ